MRGKSEESNSVCVCADAATDDSKTMRSCEGGRDRGRVVKYVNFTRTSKLISTKTRTHAHTHTRTHTRTLAEQDRVLALWYVDGERDRRPHFSLRCRAEGVTYLKRERGERRRGGEEEREREETR